eukprot:jgi/Mesen1/4798/ME000243S03978
MMRGSTIFRGVSKKASDIYHVWRREKTTGRPYLVHKRGADLLHDPWFNKGTSFGNAERDRLGIRGLLPPQVMTFDQQINRFMADFRALEIRTRDGPKDPAALAKWRILNRLHDRNEILYYKILISNIKEFAPVIYTPTVGLVCQNYSGLFRRPRGMYFSALDKGEMHSMVYNWPSKQVDIIVVTDGSRILGLGDLGVQGIGIPIGKLDLYVAAAGFNPQRDYLEILDEFMDAVFTRWPKFEDFENKWAFRLLQRYRHRYRMFNDDVQGTAGVALAGLLGAVRAQGRPMEDIAHNKVVVVGAGSAGLGVINMVRQSMARVLGGSPSASARAASNFWVLDKDGLITEAREGLGPAVKDYARPAQESQAEGGLQEGASLVEVVKSVRPDALLGLSGVGGLFTKEVLEAMKTGDNPRPAVFPMSNPTIHSECTAEEAFGVLGPSLVFASGSPFQSIEYALGSDTPLCSALVLPGGGQVGHANQGNNMYLFPGIGLGTLLAGASTVSDGMLQAAATAIREITRAVAAAVVTTAIEEDLVEGYRETDSKTLRLMSEGQILDYVEQNMWLPDYSPLIHTN